MTNSPTGRYLTVFLWNSNGVLQHFNELECILHTKRIDIALITETHLKHTSIFFMKGYTIYRSDHPANKAQGGSAILIRSTLQHNVLPLPPSTNQIQVTAISTRLENNYFTVAAVYCPPRFGLTKEQFDNLFSSLGPRFVAGGDYNAKHI